MADNDTTGTETDEDKARAAEAFDAFAAEQERLLALSHADDRPEITRAALAPRNRPTEPFRERAIEDTGSERAVEDFSDDPARGLEPEIPDVGFVRRQVAGSGDEQAAEVLDGNGPDTAAATVPAEQNPTKPRKRHTADDDA